MLAKGLGLTPTVTSLDMFASEVIREVDEAVVAFEFLTDRNELETASKRLSEAFFIGEHLPRIRTLDRQKIKGTKFCKNADALLSAMDVRDYKTANEIIDKLRLQAVDFNYLKQSRHRILYQYEQHQYCSGQNNCSKGKY